MNASTQSHKNLSMARDKLQRCMPSPLGTGCTRHYHDHADRNGGGLSVTGVGDARGGRDEGADVGSETQMGRMTIDDLLAAARSGLCRLHPVQALAAMRSGAALIDIRSDTQIARDGTIAGALVVTRNVLEWRLDPASQHRHPQAPHLGEHVILLCDEGYQSSLAAATLQQLGFTHATDVDGGFRAWRQAGLPVTPPASPV